MAVKDHVVLSSDGGSVTMGRRLAFYSYGRFDVVIPEGREQQVEDDRIQNGYIARNPGQKMGRFDFGFIRQDATINLEAQTSDLELAIDSTEKRSEGDVYVERDISRAGMNGFELGRDFGLDDIVRYRVWGNYLRLPVTAGDLESSVDGGLRGVRVHVGGQVASDSEARLRRNNEILGQIENEKRQRTRQVSQARSTADSAKSTADEAKKTADETAALVDGLDIEGSIERAREAVDSSNAILQLVRQLTGAAAAQGAQAQASASLAIEYARQAEEVLDKLDPLRDDVVAAHAEVARLSGEAAKAAQEAAAAVAAGEKQVVAAQRAANAAAQDAATSQQLVDEAEALLQELSPLQDAARKSLKDAQSLLDNAGGAGRSLADVLKEVAAKHQAVLSAHDDILATHSDVLEIHGEAIKYAAMAAAQAGAAAMQASQAAAEALRAADLNAQAIAALAEADKKLIEADKKLQEQIDVLEESQRLLAQAIRYVAAAASQAAQAAMSAAQASEENANAIAQTNIAVDAANDSIEALKGANKARDEVVGNIQKSVDSVKQAQAAQRGAETARNQTLTNVQKFSWLSSFRRVRVLEFDRWKNPNQLKWDDGSLMVSVGISSDTSSGEPTLYVSKGPIDFSGHVEVTAQRSGGTFSGKIGEFRFGTNLLYMFPISDWYSISVKVFPIWPDAKTKAEFDGISVGYRPIL
ncbi:hypothetical protein HMPREF2604_05050 [Corynebacterium sp. HMSC055A01]|uniref:hypothetical protein n=1 Tax=Corynebacterium sp. HMSC055A01 TaxID=1715083 RepID=UPI0008A3CA40|nr:hypothetical protein [Corynebacterium sp. HMSC055A01]OFN18995.1 hypothetical protein HMPREF2604_05050 [Corynebacterium sp. HMSC055A01]